MLKNMEQKLRPVRIFVIFSKGWRKWLSNYCMMERRNVVISVSYNYDDRALIRIKLPGYPVPRQTLRDTAKILFL